MLILRRVGEELESERCNGYVNTKYLNRLCYHSILSKKRRLLSSNIFILIGIIFLLNLANAFLFI